ncbi:MAG: hypothetical protein DSM107014_12440 [Gomphosphaeria aponina SAG 52.96 = DSM 107014]|uniref:Uncharacterized protein n=1 Tax=Gomphosphaeria aponina SAG 52.96 = DSM 107014 TaxID=1521640 RepID=A0A941JTI2_9CHRO|nr:hypothetical protein [Gomphosphaeria aponina SAG 52.96 = DSM 107014]
MPSQTYIVRSHARTIHTRPITFVCAKCEQLVTRECYPGRRPIYCFNCAPPRKRGELRKIVERGAFNPTHYLITPKGEKKTEVCLEKSPQPGWFWVRSALDWYNGESIIRFHQEKGLYSDQDLLPGFTLESVQSEETEEIMRVKEPKKPDVVMVEKEKMPKKVNTNVAALSGSTRPYSGREICQRFRCGDRLLTNMRSSPEFAKWSTTRDPLGVPWEYKNGSYFPLSPIEEKMKPFSGRQLCQRFHCGDKLLTKMRSSPDFTQWSQSRDPKGIGWEYRGNLYFPIDG